MGVDDEGVEMKTAGVGVCVFEARRRPETLSRGRGRKGGFRAERNVRCEMRHKIGTRGRRKKG